MAKEIKMMYDFFEKRIAQCEEKRDALLSDNRSDESNFEKIRGNIYDVFKTVLAAAEKACGENTADVKEFFIKRLCQIPTAWQNSYDKAKQYNDYEKMCIENIKLEAVSDIKHELSALWEVAI